MAIAITWAEVIALAPELAAVSIDGQNQVIAQVLLEINPSAWGSDTRAKAAALWLARHMATINGKGGVAGPVTEVHAGAVGKSFGMLAQWKSLLATTRYGQEYLRLIRLWLPRFALT